MKGAGIILEVAAVLWWWWWKGAGLIYEGVGLIFEVPAVLGGGGEGSWDHS